jgi:hypothetical protein
MSIRIRPTLPKGDQNGLVWLTEDQHNAPAAVVAVLGLIPQQVIDNVGSEDDPHGVVFGIAYIEALGGMDGEAAESLARAAYERRTGKVALPFGTVLDVNPDELPEPPMGMWEQEGGES